ncbi:MAG: hypothetical protein EOO65_04060 [Methanosarcinales archaeon]|nr:MAG: hypothetical protein EOO65_04060 [Methanosarcinales archaeon]
MASAFTPLRPVHSINPPPSHRPVHCQPVVGIAMGVHSGKFKLNVEPLDNLFLFSILLRTFLLHAESGYTYR